MSLEINLKTSFLILISLFLFSNHIFSQNLKEIDAEFMNKNKIDSNDNYINIFLFSKDCYRCYGDTQQILSVTAKEKPDLTVNVISDQIPFARKSTKEYSLNNLNFYFDNSIFGSFLKSFFYYKIDGKIISNYEQIINLLTNSYSTPSKIAIKDNRLTSDQLSLSQVGIQNNQLIVMDNSVNIGAIIGIENSNIDYYEPSTTSKKLYNLPHSLPDNLPFKDITLIKHEKLQDLKKQFPGITETKVTAIKIHDDIALAQFIVSKNFEIKEGEEKKLITLSFSYVGIKNIDSQLQDIFNIETYDYYLNMDILPYNSIDYRIGASIYYPFKILNKHSFKARIYQELDYIGEATFELSDDYSSINITSIDTEASRTYDYIFLEIDGKEYYIDKEMTDESTGEGIITLKERVINNQ